MNTGQLGCAATYTAELRTQGGEHLVSLIPASAVTAAAWDRQLGATSGASVKVRPRTPGCVRAVALARPWVHELCLWRDEVRVWEGPVTDVADDGATVTITAADVTAWLLHRIVRVSYDTTAAPAELAGLAAEMLAAAYGPADPGAARYLRPHKTGITIAGAIEAEAAMAAAHLADLVSLGLEWTVVGRRMHLFGGSTYPLARIAPLSARHFTGPLPIARAGAGTVTRVIAQGAGVRGESGGVHPQIGLLEQLATVTATTPYDVAAAAAAGLYTPQLMIAGTADVALTPAAPATVGRLVPGTACAVSGRGAALAVNTDCVITKAAGQWAAGGEKIAVSLVELTDRTGGRPGEGAV